MLQLVYPVLKQHLNAEINALKLIDWDLGQYNQAGEDHVRTTPAVYIGFDPIEWETLPKGIQRSVLSFTLTLVSHSAYGNEKDMLDTTYINHLSIWNLLYSKMQNKRFLFSQLPGNSALAGTANDHVILESVVRVSSDPHSTIDNLVVSTHRFEAMMYDYAAVPGFQTVLADLVCNLTIEDNV